MKDKYNVDVSDQLVDEKIDYLLSKEKGDNPKKLVKQNINKERNI